MHAYTHTHTHTYQVPSNSTDDVNKTNTQPTGCTLNLDSNVELYHHDDQQMDDTHVEDQGYKETPPLVTTALVREVFI